MSGAGFPASRRVTGSDLAQRSAQILNDATVGPVEIVHRDRVFVLIERAALESVDLPPLQSEPETLEDLLVGYDPASVRDGIAWWLDDEPQGREIP